MWNIVSPKTETRCVEITSATPPHIATATPFVDIMYDINDINATRAQIFRVLKASKEITKFTDDFTQEDSNWLKLELSNLTLNLDAFNAWVDENLLDEFLELHMMGKFNRETIVNEFKTDFKAYEEGSFKAKSVTKPQYTDIRTPTLSGTPTVGHPGLGGFYKSSSSTATPSSANSLNASPANGGAAVGNGPYQAAPLKNPTAVLAKRIEGNGGLNGPLYKESLTKGDPVLKFIKDAQELDRKLNQIENPTVDAVSADPKHAAQLAKLNSQVEEVQALVDATVERQDAAKQKLDTLDLTMSDLQGDSFAAANRIEELKKVLERNQRELDEETKKVKDIDALLEGYNAEKVDSDAAVEAATAEVAGKEHMDRVEALKGLKTAQTNLVNQGKPSKEEIEAMKEERNQSYVNIHKDVEFLKDLLVAKHTLTKPEDINIFYCGPDLPTVEFKKYKSGELTLVTAKNPSTGNYNCGTRAMITELVPAPINLVLVGKKRTLEDGDVGQKRRLEGEDEGQKPAKEGKVKKGKRTKDGPNLPKGKTTKTPK